MRRLHDSNAMDDHTVSAAVKWCAAAVASIAFGHYLPPCATTPRMFRMGRRHSFRRLEAALAFALYRPIRNRNFRPDDKACRCSHRHAVSMPRAMRQRYVVDIRLLGTHWPGRQDSRMCPSGTRRRDSHVLCPQSSHRRDAILSHVRPDAAHATDESGRPHRFE